MAWTRDDSEEDENQNKAGGGTAKSLLGGYEMQQQAVGGIPGLRAPPAAPRGSGPTATGRVNFDSLYAANYGTAQRGAGMLGGYVQQQADKARGGLGKAQTSYGNQVATGSLVNGPTTRQTMESAQGFGKSNMANPARAPSAGAAMQPQGDVMQARTPESMLAGWQRNADAKYTGPDDISQNADYQTARADAQKAEKQLGALGSDAGLQALVDEQKGGPHIEGGSKLDAALYGQAGRPEFARLQRDNAGLRKEFGDALTVSKAQADEARKQTAINAGGFGGLLGNYERGEAEREAANRPIVIGAAPGVGGTSSQIGVVAGEGGDLRDESAKEAVWRDLGVDQAGRDNYDKQKAIIEQLGLTEDDMEALMAMTPEQRKAWLAQRKAQRGIE